MNAATIFVFVLILAAAVLAVRAIAKGKAGSSCGGNCAHCSGCKEHRK